MSTDERQHGIPSGIPNIDSDLMLGGRQVVGVAGSQPREHPSSGDVRVNIDDDLPGPSGHHMHSHNAPAQQQHEIHPLSIVMPYVSKFGVFVLVLLLKVLYSHRYGLLILVATVLTWYHADYTLTTQITLRGHDRYKQFVTSITWVIIFLSLNLFGIYYFLNVKVVLSRRLIFSIEGLNVDVDFCDIYMLLWVLILNDYAIKYATIIIKSLITLVPRNIISHQQKGSLYSVLERTTQFYRSLVPIIPWYYFLFGASDGPWFSAVLFIVYVIFKFLDLYNQLIPLKNSIVRVFTKQGSYGTKPNDNEVKESGGTCPVCHDEYSTPIMLGCKHIFCEDCVLVWFDKETSCPMCRAKIITGDNSYRDGSSTWTVQFF